MVLWDTVLPRIPATEKIAVLGCGPAGLLAAHAVALSGATPYIYARKEKSKISGAVYLHSAIPGLHESASPEDTLEIRKYGSARGYALKVYGDPQHDVSFTRFSMGLHPMWYMREAYDKLWENYNHLVVAMELTHETINKLTNSFSLVLSTVPAKALCFRPKSHRFWTKDVVIEMHDQEWEKNPLMVYDGTYHNPFYRYSSIGDVRSYEYAKPPSHRGRFVPISKPLWTDCSCHLNHSNFERLGRYGRWEKGILTHHAFQSALAALGERTK